MANKHLLMPILISFAGLCGCRSLPDAHLGNCEHLDSDLFVRNFPLGVPEPLQYHYTLYRRSKTVLSANGITHKTGEGAVDIAGFSSVGMTLYSSRWQDGRFEILKNNTRLPDKVLERSVLRDVLLPYCQLPAAAGCVRRDAVDGSLWLETDLKLAGGNGYFVVRAEQLGWGAIRDKKVCFKAVVTQKKGDAPARITIENFSEGYEAEIRISNEDSAIRFTGYD